MLLVHVPAHLYRVGQKQVYTCECVRQIYSCIIMLFIELLSIRTTVNLLLPHPVYFLLRPSQGLIFPVFALDTFSPAFAPHLLQAGFYGRRDLVVKIP